MSKEILILPIICLLMLGTGVVSYAAGPIKDTTNVQEHIKVHLEKVKISNPKKYQEMVERAKGNITDCLSCHIEVAESSKFPAKGKIERIQPMRR
ncbi:MAG: hypothetical protein WC769_06815 [Thermodesulfovibrionales bacterium]|jgi:hypothetical protein